MEKTLRKIIGIMEENPNIKAYAVIGGLAVGGWATPRATKDIDILIELSKTDRAVIEMGVLNALIESGFQGDLKTGGPEDDIKFCIKAVSREGVPVDLIFAARKWECDIAADTLKIELMKGLFLPIVRPEGLVVLKLRAGSFQDIADASKILTETEYDLKKLIAFAKRARVDKRLKRLMERLGLKTGGGR